MKVALGFKPHSGWTSLIAIGKDDEDYVILNRRRVELVEEEWAKQPYHAAEELEAKEAEMVVRRGVQVAHSVTLREMRAALKQERSQGHEVIGCAVVVGNPMPKWSVAEILAVHFRMHQAEGVLFREALVIAATKCKIPVTTINDKLLMKDAQGALKISSDQLQKKLAALGKIAGPPWGKDQKEAAVAAMIALEN